MKTLRALACSAAAVLIALAPAAARDSFVQDQAAMFGQTTATALNSRIGNFNAQTGKEVVVMTVPSLAGAQLKDAAERAFAQQQVNGVLIYIAKDDRRDIIVPDRAGVSAGWFDTGTLQAIRQSMEAQFKDGDFDGGITTAVSGVLGIYRSHLRSRNAAAPVGATSRGYANSASTGGFHLSGFWLIVILVAAFLVLRSVMRAMSTPRTPYGQPPGQPGGPGYGPGYGGGGGGGFFSGLLGGLGGAWLGNEMFGGNRGGGGGDSGGSYGGSDVAGGGAADAGGWGSDAGQADMGGSSGGDWSGGGFGGGDAGGGGGDSGGGW